MPEVRLCHHYWKASKEQFQCAGCGYRIGLRNGTVMQASKLPFRYWFIAMHLLTATKQTFSSLEVQRQLGHKRYQPVWEMMHKLRSLMGIRDGKYMLDGEIEIDEAFFTTETPVDKKGRMLKAGAGSERKAKVLVMAESRESENPKPGQKPRKVRHLKMQVIPDLRAATIAGSVLSGVDCRKSTAITDASKSHSRFSEMFGRHISRVVEPNREGPSVGAYSHSEREDHDSRDIPRSQGRVPSGIPRRVLLQVQQKVSQGITLRASSQCRHRIQIRVHAQDIQQESPGCGCRVIDLNFMAYFYILR